MNAALKVFHFEGIRPDSLGSYLVGPGLLSAVSRKWAEVRACWRSGHFVLVYPSENHRNIEDYLIQEWTPTDYRLWWREQQKADSKAKSDERLQKARGKEVIEQVRILDAHVVSTGRLQFNPLFGTGGNIAKRNLGRVHEKARKLIKEADEHQAREWLSSTLLGVSTVSLPDLESAGTWFVFANKTFNSGQRWYREGKLSPWSFLLALEGALLLSGGVGRRMGSRARPYAVFPFVTDVPSPLSREGIGLVKAEFWAPVWECPANITEVRTLFERGLGRIGLRAAKAPHEFAIAALATGVDAGVAQFVRFSLQYNTSDQTYEAVPTGKVYVNPAEAPSARLVEQILPWLDRLPREPRSRKQGGKFLGLRGLVEERLIEAAERPHDSESWQRLLLAVADIQSRIDRNKELRERCIPVPLLRPAWFEKAWPVPSLEVQVSRAIASVGSGGEMPILVNIYGVAFGQNGKPKFEGTERPPRAVWHSGNPVRMLANAIERRLVDADAGASVPLGGPRKCGADVIASFLCGDLGFEEIVRWIPSFSLIGWQSAPHAIAARNASDEHGAYLLQALFRPFFHPSEIVLDGHTVFPANIRPSAVTALRLLSLIRGGAWDEAISVARDRYLAAGFATVEPAFGGSVETDEERLAASLLIPMYGADVAAGLRRWLLPEKETRIKT